MLWRTTWEIDNWRGKHSEGFPLWELRTSRLVRISQLCVSRISALEMEKEEHLYTEDSLKRYPPNVSYHDSILTRYAMRRINKELKQWNLRFNMIQRERQYRRDAAYRGFINKIIHEPRNKAIHLLAFADWLEEYGNNLVQSRRVKRQAEELQ